MKKIMNLLKYKQNNINKGINEYPNIINGILKKIK